MMHLKYIPIVLPKEQKIVIKASSGLADEEIEKMISEAESNAEERMLAAVVLPIPGKCIQVSISLGQEEESKQSCFSIN